MEIYIPIFNGNKVHHVAQSSRSRLQVAAMNNFSNFGVDRTIVPGAKRFFYPPHPNPLPPAGGRGDKRKNFWQTLYLRPETERLATGLNEKYFPGPELEPAARLIDRIDVKVIPGHDPGPRQPADVPQAQVRGSLGLSPPGTAARSSPINRF